MRTCKKIAKRNGSAARGFRLMIYMGPVLLAWAAGGQAGDANRPPPSDDSMRLVFFEPDSAVLGDKSMPVLELAIQIANDPQVTRAIVTGYCDVNESRAGRCPALALQRADSVKAALIKLGMRGDMIEETTADDLFDPADQRLNRRVSIAPMWKNDP